MLSLAAMASHTLAHFYFLYGFCKLLTHTAVASTLFGRIELLSEALIVIMIQLRLVSQCISCPVSRAAMFGH